MKSTTSPNDMVIKERDVMAITDGVSLSFLVKKKKNTFENNPFGRESRNYSLSGIGATRLPDYLTMRRVCVGVKKGIYERRRDNWNFFPSSSSSSQSKEKLVKD